MTSVIAISFVVAISDRIVYLFDYSLYYIYCIIFIIGQNSTERKFSFVMSFIYICRCHGFEWRFDVIGGGKWRLICRDKLKQV